MRMRERGFSNVAAVLLGLAAALLVAPLLMTWVVVDVETAPPENVHIKLPVPLALIRAVVAFVPADEIPDHLPAGLKEHRAEVLAALRGLLDAPDGTTFVTVDAPDARVRVAKQGRSLQVDVDADDAVVHCAVPLDGALAALERWDWEHVRPGMAVELLARAERGNLVKVDAPDAKVSIDIW